MMPSSSLRPARRSRSGRNSVATQRWTYAALDEKDLVLWYCPPGGGESDRCHGIVQIQAYFKSNDVAEFFNFKLDDVPAAYIRVHLEEEQEGDDGYESSTPRRRGSPLPNGSGRILRSSSPAIPMERTVRADV